MMYGNVTLTGEYQPALQSIHTILHTIVNKVLIVDSLGSLMVMTLP